MSSEEVLLVSPFQPIPSRVVNRKYSGVYYEVREKKKSKKRKLDNLTANPHFLFAENYLSP